MFPVDVWGTSFYYDKYFCYIPRDMQHRGIYQIPLEAETILMKDLLDQVLIKHGLHQRPGMLRSIFYWNLNQL